MLDLETLFATQPSGATVPKRASADEPAKSLDTHDVAPDSLRSTMGDIGHSGHNENAPIYKQLCPPEPLPHKAFNGLGTVGTLGTVDFQGGEYLSGYGAPGGGAARESFALNSAAVVLVMAYCEKVKAGNDKRVSAMFQLQALPPGEQVKHWHSFCLEVGIKPWEVLTTHAPTSGLDCTMCKHLMTRQMASDDGRRQFHWACGLGYLILETGRGTERIWIAPPECSSWERWYPSEQR